MVVIADFRLTEAVLSFSFSSVMYSDPTVSTLAAGKNVNWSKFPCVIGREGESVCGCVGVCVGKRDR